MSNLKTFVGVFFFLLALNNLQAGCPDLAETYVCPHLKGLTLNVVQTTAADSTINYAFLEEDGRIKHQFMTGNIKHTHSLYNFTYRAYCAGNKDIAHLVTVYDNKFQQQISYSLTEDGSLRIEGTFVDLKTGKTHGDSYICSVKRP